MEELDDLKSIWRQQPLGYDSKNKEEIARMLQGKSSSIVSKLKRSVWFELVFTIVCGVGLAAYGLYAKSGQLAWMVLTLSIIFGTYILYYIKKLNLLSRYNLTSENLRNNLEHLVNGLSAYLSFYKRSYTILYPVFFCIGLLFGAMDAGLDNFLHRFSQISFLIWFVLVTAIFMVGVYKITDWYLKKLYGDHLEKLKTLLAELSALS
jgi:ABC-type multidrug transport system fused ATPase/permease subunit